MSVAPKTKPKRKPGRRWLGRGLLWAIAGLFAASGALRVAEIGAQARATEAEPPHQSEAPAAQGCETAPGMMEMLADLKAREARIIEQEALLSDRRVALTLAEDRLETRLAELIAAEEALSRTVAIADSASEKDVARLVTLYENMKPKQAAPLFAEMAPEFAAGFLARMRPDTAAAVMESLEPKKAYSISVLMAGRNANAPQD